MEFVKTYEQKIWYNYLKQNVEWLYLNMNSYLKKCEFGYWLH